MSWLAWILGIPALLFGGFYLGIRFIFSMTFFDSFMDGLLGRKSDKKK